MLVVDLGCANRILYPNVTQKMLCASIRKLCAHEFACAAGELGVSTGFHDTIENLVVAGGKIYNIQVVASPSYWHETDYQPVGSEHLDNGRRHINGNLSFHRQ